MTYMTKKELQEAIANTERQEKLFRAADELRMTAWWMLERVRLRAQLYELIQREVSHENHDQR